MQNAKRVLHSVISSLSFRSDDIFAIKPGRENPRSQRRVIIVFSSRSRYYMSVLPSPRQEGIV